MIISHRGRKTGERENSIKSFEKALKLGAGGIECDLRLTRDDQVVVYHDDVILQNGKKIKISKTPLGEIQKTFSQDKRPLVLDELFEFIKIKNVPFFLELKSSSPILVQQTINRIEKENLWKLVHIIGFSVFIKTALKFQKEYPKLRAMPFLNIPLFSFVRPPQKSYGVFVGWIDEWKGNRYLFRRLMSENRLRKLKDLYQERGFKIMAGVINNKDSFEYFKNSGIRDIVTDEIKLASAILNT
ncbi:MAG: hypothetical protein A3B44_00655 [Candidatus Levybacteria bacterium RIFCSPLOWO2_01_FULL_38_21]|nr:MAG: hypothetical protein A3B44_00655 [Candidatus Levybacteria bacterium RIFCSPLOWO2_01_FULL_38_21]